MCGGGSESVSDSGIDNLNDFARVGWGAMLTDLDGAGNFVPVLARIELAKEHSKSR